MSTNERADARRFRLLADRFLHMTTDRSERVIEDFGLSGNPWDRLEALVDAELNRMDESMSDAASSSIDARESAADEEA